MSLTENTKRWLKANAAASLSGKTVLITGANSGVGYKTAETLVYLGAAVIMACRNEQRAAQARAALLQEYPDAVISVMKLDMADFSSIDSFVKELEDKAIDIDGFLNNAGVFHQPDKRTADGFELVIGTNYIGVFYLCERMMPYLRSLRHEVTVVNTISMIHQIATVDYDDFYYQKHYGNFRVYARAKLCLAKYTYALAHREERGNIRVLMSHPGIAITPLGVNAYGKVVKQLAGVGSRLFNSPEKSSLSLAYLLSHDFPAGSIIGPTGGFGGWGYPKKNRICRKVRTGAEELIRFTHNEIDNAKGRV